jgi:hypothetical protein
MRDIKSDMLRVLAELRKTILDEETDLNSPGVREAFAQVLNGLEAYLIEKENW